MKAITNNSVYQIKKANFFSMGTDLELIGSVNYTS